MAAKQKMLLIKKYERNMETAIVSSKNVSCLAFSVFSAFRVTDLEKVHTESKFK